MTNSISYDSDMFDWRIRVFDSLSFPTLILKPDRTIVAANLKFFERTGISEDQAIGKTCEQIFFGNKKYGNLPCLGKNCTLERCVTRKRAQSIVLKDIDSHNDKMWEERVFSPILNDKGEVSYIIESLRDITKVKTLEKKYSDIRQLIDKVVQSSVSGILAADRKGEIILINDAAEKLY